MSETIGPAIARERLSARLRELRESRGLSSAEVEARLTWPASVIDEVESGVRPLGPLEAEALLGLYEVDGPEAEHLLLLAHAARPRLWWARNGLTDEFQNHVAYEAEAVRISINAPLFVPGLLQTPRYARALTAAILGRPEDDPVVSARVQLRAERQSLLAERVAAGEAVEIFAVVDESVLRRVVGGGDVMGEQLDRLVVEATRDHVSLVILPIGLGPHRGLGGVFELLEFGDEPDRPRPGSLGRSATAVFLESAASDQRLHDPRAIDVHRQIMSNLVATGVGGDDAIALLRSIRDELTGE